LHFCGASGATPSFPTAFRVEIEQFFNVYKDLEGLPTQTAGFGDRAEAVRVLAEARARSAAAETGRLMKEVVLCSDYSRRFRARPQSGRALSAHDSESSETRLVRQRRGPTYANGPLQQIPLSRLGVLS
jgi:hypothetical protein